MIRTFSHGGVHPDDSKLSRESAIEEFPLPEVAWISMAQHLGAPAQPAVAPGDEVMVGSVIGTPSGFMSAFVHSPYSGTVQAVEPHADLAGNMVMHVAIKVEGDRWLESIDRSTALNRDITLGAAEIIEKIKAAGVVGLGGAAFPTHIKLAPPPGKVAECLILNGTECEPYLTSDDRIMRERPREIIIGAVLLMKALGVKTCYIGIENNKPEAIASMNEAREIFPSADIRIIPLKKKYPQGGEKQLINAILRRDVPSLGLPVDAGAVVQNVGTSLAVYEAVQKNKPLIDNTLSVTGRGLKVQKNFKVRVGTPLSSLMKAAGEMPGGDIKIISGGPMMGKAVSNPEATTLKATSSVLILTGKETLRKAEGNCIRCGKCAEACPMALKPWHLNSLARHGGMDDEMEKAHIYDCIECGCCLYTCPANIPLLDVIRIAKADVVKIMRSRKK